MLGWLARLRTAHTARSALTVTALAATTWAAPAALGSEDGSTAAAEDQVAPDTMERRVVHWTNVARGNRGLPPLGFRECPDQHAEPWARHLARSGSFYHQDVTQMFSCSGVNVAGENLARGRTTAREVVRAWMHSESHRANLLKPRFTHIGVGATYAADGRIYISQTFTGR
jgi:uncharacterized protein YkwD